MRYLISPTRRPVAGREGAERRSPRELQPPLAPFGSLRAAPRPPRKLEQGLALAMLLLGSPLLVLVGLLVLFADGRPVLYRGERLGLRKRPFTLYKFRTLSREAECRTADRLLEPTDGLEIPGGRFLRDCRLDELPQLWNIFRGDMAFLGPRPERPRVYELLCATIPGYARRFDVRPGMIGPSQLFTPHATPKRFRTLIDNAWCRRAPGAGLITALVLRTLLAVVGRIASRTWEYARDDLLRARLLRRYRQRRRFRRVRPARAVARLAPEGSLGRERTARLLDVGPEALLVRTDEPLELAQGATVQLELEIGLARGRHDGRIRTARCTARVAALRPHGTDLGLVLTYRPITPRDQYVLLQYFLEDSLARPPACRPIRRDRRGRRDGTRAEPGEAGALRPASLEILPE